MRRACFSFILLAAIAAYGQKPDSLPAANLPAANLDAAPGPAAPGSGTPPSPAFASESPDAQLPGAPASASPLPDSPGFLLQADKPQTVIAVAKVSFATSSTKPPPCRSSHWIRTRSNEALPDSSTDDTLTCVDILNPYLRFLDTRFSIPMTPAQKGYLAFRNLTDPFNFATIAASSAVTLAIDSHTAYGPAWKGFGKLAGVTLLQDTTGEFFGTFLIPSVTHEDPHYHRLPHAPIVHRILHAVSRTVVAQHDDGSPMPNYATLLTYPIAAEISNLYVPGIQSDGRSTAVRILTGYALDPVNNIVTEFLPDVARRVHIRVIFVQQILNQVVAGQGTNGQNPF